MANGSTHSIVGGLAGLVVAIGDTDQSGNLQHDFLLAMGVGTAFSKLPDVLEPSLNNPHHRQFCHSVIVLGLIGYGLKKAYEWRPQDRVEAFARGLALCAGAGYLSHLLLDATSSRSLPFCGKFN